MAEKDKIICKVKVYLDDDFIEVKLKASDFICGFAPLFALKKNDDETVFITTMAVSKDLKVVVPPRGITIAKDDYENKKLDIGVKIFNNKKAIYTLKYGTYYVIDLDKVSFKKDDNNYVPINPILKLDGFAVINDDEIIAYLNNTAFLYNVAELKKESKIYDNISPSIKYDDLFSAFYYYRNNKYTFPLEINLLINNKKGILKQVMLNKTLAVFLPEEIIGNKEKTIKYCDDCYNSFIESQEDDLGYKKVLN